PFLIKREKEELIERENLAGVLANELKSDGARGETASASELIQILKDPRVVAERFNRLELEAERQFDAFTKPPFFNKGNNPAEEKALRRGVKVRSIYEKAALEHAEI